MAESAGNFGISSEQWGLAVLTATSIPNFYSGLLPSKMTIARFAADESDRLRLRQAETIATIMSVAEAVGASLIAKSWLPLILSGGVVVVLIWQYEDAIRHPHPDSKPINSDANSNRPAYGLAA